MTDNWIVIPCFNEAARIDGSQIACLISDPSVVVLLVDDGSTDATLERLTAFKSVAPNQVEIMSLAANVGKAEAVRQGMNEAVRCGAGITGYLDADFATPATEMLRLLTLLRAQSDVNVLLGSRWLHLGSNIQRSNLRHYPGRIFATLASNVLGMPVYDTQCGAKLFRITPTFTAAIAAPFLTRWAFDVELIGRLREGMADAGYTLAQFTEVPLQVWIDVPGSKIGLLEMLHATFALSRIAGSLKQLRQQRDP